MCDHVMEEISTESVQTLGSQPSPDVLDCLSNSVIVRKVLEHFSDRELLDLSFVNKLWNYEARSVIRKRGKLIAHLKSDSTHPWQQVLEAFGTDLKNMNTVPYSGITIKMGNEGHPVRSATLDLTQEAVLSRLALKRVSVSMFGAWWMHKDSPALLLVKKLFQYFGGVLEEIKLFIGHKREEFVKHFIGDCNFPSLKVLKLEEFDYSTSGESYTNYMKALVSRAKSLQELNTRGPTSLMSNVLEGSAAVRVHNRKVRAPFGTISECVMDTLRLRSMDMKYTGSEFNYERFNRITPMLLQASCSTTLLSMEFDAVLAIPLMSYGIPLINVDDACMNINYDQMLQVEPEILRIVKNFDFTRILPSVHQVTISSHFDDFEYSLDHLDSIIEQADAVLGEPMPDRAAYIKELCLDECDISDAAVSFFAEMFPDTELLKIWADEEEVIPFESIWKHWVDLRELQASGSMIQNSGNLDSVFCGIFPEEVAELRLKDEDYLKTVHIVPVMPAITCLKNLRSLSLNPDRRTMEPHVEDGTFMFSKVTGLIAFAKFPSLAIRFHLYDGIAETSHLKAFATVTVF